MTTDHTFEDIWSLQPRTSDAPSERAIDVRQIDGVIPLDDQFGVHPLKSVPDALQVALFGDPALKTYAILDAAKVPNLPQVLEESGLEHRCLFKGDAFDELKDVAPWIVQLKDDDAFTRNLFTRSDAPWHLWDQEPGIYLRSSGSLNDLWRHFRKFTKIQNEQSKWFYFRFWEGDFVGSYLEAMTGQQSRAFFGNGLVGELIRLGAMCQCFRLASVAPLSPEKVKMTLNPAIYTAFSERALARFWQNQREKHASQNTISDEGFTLLRRQIDALGLKSAAAITALLDLCADSHVALLEQVWVRDELDKSQGMPDRIRVDRLVNLAEVIDSNGN